MQHRLQLALVLALSLVCVTDAFVPLITSLVRRCSSVVTGERHRSASIGLRCSGSDDSQNPKIIKLGTTKTSWQGWGSTTVKKTDLKIPVDPANPEGGIKEALLQARESEAIAKYLGTSESKIKAGITGDVEFVSYSNGELILRLTGNFWHNRQMVFDEVGTFIKGALPAGTVNEVTIEDPKQLQGFAETSNAFKDQRQITVEELRAREAKGKDIYGNKLEGPAAEFKRKKLAATQKYKEEMQKRRELENADAQTQLDTILQDQNVASLFQPGAGGAAAPVKASADLRPEDILNAMLNS